MDTSSSVRNETTLSIPPYSFGGTASVSGAIWYLPKPSPCQPGNSYTSDNAAVLIQIKFFEAPVAHDATHDGAVLLLHPCLFVLAGLSHGRAAVARAPDS